MSDQAVDRSSDASPVVSFSELGLPDFLLQALQAVGYETPSPIQAQTIPVLLQGRDVLGQAQTGTGKTAAFALPLLAQIDINQRAVQAIVLAPTRELAIQVAEALQKYAVNSPGFHVLPIYGGQSYGPQLSSLKRGVHVVVGTPGRVMDHLKRGTLNLGQVRMVVLDEADEMLNMGFLEDVEWILQQMPAQRQVALFSATMPNQIKRIAQTYLRDPAEVLIRSKTTTASNIRQRYWMVSGLHKVDALTRMLEVETFDAMIIFARTKIATESLAEKLEARGYAVAPLNGDVPQQVRERTVQRLRDGHLDIIVATDVAARGLNVERITHVLNFDIPLDIESYVHRIGRTGRAGRSGEAILFVSPRERRMLQAIERATRQPIAHMEMPTVEAVNNQRIERFKQRITDMLAEGDLDLFRDVVTQYEQEHNIPAIEMAAALAKMAHESKSGKSALLLSTQRTRKPYGDDRAEAPAFTREPRAPKFDKPAFDKPKFEKPSRAPREESSPISGESFEGVDTVVLDEPAPHQFKKERQRPRDESNESAAFAAEEHEGRRGRHDRHDRDDGESSRDPVPMETYRVAVGHEHRVKPGNIVGAIANEAGIDSRHIGRIEIFDTYSLVDLPEGMPKEILQHLKKVWVAGQELRISLQRPSSPVARGPREFGAARDEGSERPARAPRERMTLGGGDRKPRSSAPFKRSSRERSAPAAGSFGDRSDARPFTPRDRADRPAKAGFAGGRKFERRDSRDSGGGRSAPRSGAKPSAKRRDR